MFNLRINNKIPIMALSVALIAATAYLDYFTGFEVSFTAFYIIPLILLSRYYSIYVALLASLTCALLSVYIRVIGGLHFANPAIPYWNGLVLFITFSTICLIIKLLERERISARMDFLTGAFNRLGFISEYNAEMNRAGRSNRPFTMIYADLDNFKKINDRFGHDKGDYILKIAVVEMKRHLREYDKVVRLGGDEFLIFLPETGPESAASTIQRIKSSFEAAAVVEDLKVTISAGVLTFKTPPESLEQVLIECDKLMYKAKQSGKNTIVSGIYSG